MPVRPARVRLAVAADGWMRRVAPAECPIYGSCAGASFADTGIPPAQLAFGPIDTLHRANNTWSGWLLLILFGEVVPREKFFGVLAVTCPKWLFAVSSPSLNNLITVRIAAISCCR
jgi:hypothetical protein